MCICWFTLHNSKVLTANNGSRLSNTSTGVSHGWYAIRNIIRCTIKHGASGKFIRKKYCLKMQNICADVDGLMVTDKFSNKYYQNWELKAENELNSKKVGFSVKIQLCYLKITYTFRLLFCRHYQADTKNIKRSKYYSCNTGWRFRTVWMCYIKNITYIMWIW